MGYFFHDTEHQFRFYNVLWMMLFTAVFILFIINTVYYAALRNSSSSVISYHSATAMMYIGIFMCILMFIFAVWTGYKVYKGQRKIEVLKLQKLGLSNLSNITAKDVKKLEEETNETIKLMRDKRLIKEADIFSKIRTSEIEILRNEINARLERENRRAKDELGEYSRVEKPVSVYKSDISGEPIPYKDGESPLVDNIAGGSRFSRPDEMTGGFTFVRPSD